MNQIIGGMFGLKIKPDGHCNAQPPFLTKPHILLSTARSGITFLVECLHPSSVVHPCDWIVWMPSYLCDVMLKAVDDSAVRFYPVDAHLKPEILLVDEVLAVGDAAFQKKCLGKMGDVAREGWTVLFVSHNMVAVQSLCSRAFWLNDGEVVEEGLTRQVISKYLQSSFSTLTEQVWDDIGSAPGTDKVRLHRVRVRPEDGKPSDQITTETPFAVDVDFWNLVPGSRFHITLHFYAEQGIVAFTSGSGLDPTWGGRPLQAALYRNTCHIPGNLLNSGRHRVAVLIVEDLRRVVYRHEDAVSFDVVDLTNRREGWFGKEPGVVQPMLKWTTECLEP